MSTKECFSKKILVADDLPAARADLVQILKDIGFTNIDEANDGKDAWEKLKDQAFFGDPYDLLITDIYMPFINGVQLLKKARAVDIYKKIPIVLISTENEKGRILTSKLINRFISSDE